MNNAANVSQAQDADSKLTYIGKYGCQGQYRELKTCLE